MKQNLNEKYLNEIMFMKCKECSYQITENLNKPRLEILNFKEKTFYAVKSIDARYFLFAGKNKLLNISINSFLYEEILCITCKKKLGIRIKSSREDLKYLINNYFLIKTKKVLL